MNGTSGGQLGQQLQELIAHWEREAWEVEKRPDRVAELTPVEVRLCAMHARVLRVAASDLRNLLNGKGAPRGRR